MMLTNDWAVLPHNINKVKDHYVVASFLGNWVALNESEFRQLNRLSPGIELFNKLKKGGLLIGKDGMDSLVADYRKLHAGLFNDAGLHIAVLTEKCNFNCRYCQAEKTLKKTDMSEEVAWKILGFLFSARNPFVRLEFQGGEPLLNWPTLEFFVIQGLKQNKFEKKQLMMSLVSNLSLLDKKKTEFLIKNKVTYTRLISNPTAAVNFYPKTNWHRNNEPNIEDIPDFQWFPKKKAPRTKILRKRRL